MAFCLLPVYADGYKLENIDGKYVCRGTFKCPAGPTSAFGSTVLWALEQTVDPKEENAHAFDAKNLTVAMRPYVADSSVTYSFTLTIKISESNAEFCISDAKATPDGFIGTLTAVRLDKTNIAKKPKQKVYIDNFGTFCNKYAGKMVKDITERKITLKHWEEISKGQVVKGMTPDECVLSLGKPVHVAENSQRTQWTYESGRIVVFENGVVSVVVE